MTRRHDAYARMWANPVPTLAEVRAMAGETPPRETRRRPPVQAVSAPPTLDLIYRPEVVSSLQVVLTQSARDSITYEARRYVPSSGRESGGWLLGDRIGDRLLVRSATGPGADSTRAVGSLSRTLGDAETRARRHGLTLLGGWHTHPNGARDLSTTDQQTDASLLDGIRSADDDYATPFVEMIATPTEGSMAWPTLTGYVARYRRDYRPNVRAVRIDRAEVVRP
jgi:proteasome lid subunit RPN8/RPN11